MLKPAEPEAASSSGAPMPCFDVEMTAEGKYLLVPRDNSASSSSTRNVFSTPAKVAQSASAAVKMGMYLGGGSQFSQNLSYGYAAILEVFKHLSVKERAASARVCKLWRDVSRHPSLWTSISLKVRKIFLEIKKYIFIDEKIFADKMRNFNVSFMQFRTPVSTTGRGSPGSSPRPSLGAWT